MDHVTSRFTDSLRGAGDRKGEVKRAERERNRERERGERKRDAFARTHTRPSGVCHVHMALYIKACASTYQLESTRLVPKCS